MDLCRSDGGRQGIPECDAARDKVEKNCPDLNRKASCPDKTKVKAAEKSRLTRKAQSRRSMGRRQRDISGIPITRGSTDGGERVRQPRQEDPEERLPRALRCFLSPYKPSLCCPGQTPHHIVDAASFLEPAPGVERDDPATRRNPGGKTTMLTRPRASVSRARIRRPEHTGICTCGLPSRRKHCRIPRGSGHVRKQRMLASNR